MPLCLICNEEMTKFNYGYGDLYICKIPACIRKSKGIDKWKNQSPTIFSTEAIHSDILKFGHYKEVEGQPGFYIGGSPDFGKVEEIDEKEFEKRMIKQSKKELKEIRKECIGCKSGNHENCILLKWYEDAPSCCCGKYKKVE